MTARSMLRSCLATLRQWWSFLIWRDQPRLVLADGEFELGAKASVGSLGDEVHEEEPQASVPFPTRELREVVDRYQRTSILVRHLAMVEQTLRVARGDPFACIPATVLERALHQLEALPEFGRQPGLQLVHLKMRRRLAEHQARVEVQRTGEVVKWRVESPRSTAASPRQLPTLIDSVVDTLPWSSSQGYGQFEPTRPFDIEDRSHG